MLDDIEYAKKNLNKFKRGLSIFEDQTLRAQLTSKTAAPILSNLHLKNNFSKTLHGESKIGYGPTASIS